MYGTFKCEVHTPNDVHTTHYLLLHTSLSMYKQAASGGRNTIVKNILSTTPVISITAITYTSSTPVVTTAYKKESNLFIILSFDPVYFSIRSLGRFDAGGTSIRVIGRGLV